MMFRSRISTCARKAWVGGLACQFLMACSTPFFHLRVDADETYDASRIETTLAAPTFPAMEIAQVGPQSASPTDDQRRTIYAREGPAPRAEAGPETWIVLTVFLVSMSALTGFVLLRTLPPFCDASLGCHQAP